MKVWIEILEALITALCVSLVWALVETQLAPSALVTLVLLVAVGWALFSMLMSMFWREL